MDASGIVSLVLPVFLVILFGRACRRFNILGARTVEEIKSLAGGWLLPVVIFNAYLTAEVSGAALLTAAMIFAAQCAALSVGWFTRKLAAPRDTYMPALVAVSETGMLGFTLFSMLAGSDKLSYMAVNDMGQGFFSFTIYLSFLRSRSGEKLNPREAVRSMFRSRIFIALLLGFALSAMGVGRRLLAAPAGAVYKAVIACFSAPLSFMVLLCIGYQLSFKKRALRPALLTAAVRLAVQAALCFAVSALASSIFAYDPLRQLSFLIYFSLPASFIIPVLARGVPKPDEEYISTSLSVMIALTLAAFSVISACSGAFLT